MVLSGIHCRFGGFPGLIGDSLQIWRFPGLIGDSLQIWGFRGPWWWSREVPSGGPERSLVVVQRGPWWCRTGLSLCRFARSGDWVSLRLWVR